MEQLRKDLSNIQTGERPVHYARVRESTSIKLPLVIKVSVMVIIDLFYLSAVFEKHEQSIQSLANAHSIVAASDTVSKLFAEAVENLRGYSASKSPIFVDRYNSSLNQLTVEFNGLYSFGHTDPSYRSKLRAADVKVQESLNYLKAIKDHLDLEIGSPKADTDAHQIAEDLKNTYLGSSKLAPLDRDLLTTSFRLQDDLRDVTKEARATIVSDPVTISRRWLIFEVLAMMMLNMMLVLGLGKSLGTETKKRIWHSADN
jgi:hypothetical protein